MTRSFARMSAFSAIVVAFWSLFGAPAEAALCTIPSEKGSWTNIDRATRGITRLDFDVECIPRTERRCSGDVCSVRSWFELVYRAHPFGACSPRDCDWGTQTGTKRGEWYLFRFDQGFGVKSVWVRYYPARDRLRVWTHATYRDTRADRTSDEWFRN